MDEAPVPNAGIAVSASSSEMDSGLCSRRRVYKMLDRSSVIAAAHAADVIAVSVELANPAAVAITVVIISVAAGGDGAADNGCTDKAGADTKAKTPGLY